MRIPPARQKGEPALLEFVVILSLMMSLTALSIDAMLPSLALIGVEMGVQNANERQLIVSILFLGLSIGQLFFGPLSDHTGRKPAIYSGFALFILGSMVSAVSPNFQIMLIGRLLQGLGVSAPRAVTLALVRDRFEGRSMARVMSFVSTIFILIPMVAPSIGQAILHLAGWRSIFILFIAISLATLTWFSVRMPETLATDKRTEFSLRRITSAMVEVIGIRRSIGYTLSAGLVSGAFIGYINSSQQILQEQYRLGDLFPIYFSVIALSIGFASLLNARLVMKYGMRFLVRLSLVTILILTVASFGVAVWKGGHPPLWFLMSYLLMTFFCIGILFGNQNSLAMEPLGHLAGVGSAVVGSISTLISMTLGTIIGQSYNGTVLPAISGLGILAMSAIFVVRWAEGKKVSTKGSEFSLTD